MSKPVRLQVKRGSSSAKEERQAVSELRDQISLDGARLTLFFCSPAYDRKLLAAELRAAFPEPIVGCTTAGELGTSGFARGGITGLSLAGDIDARPYVLDLDNWEKDLPGIAAEIAANGRANERCPAFGLLLVDGLSRKEERLISALYQGLPTLPVFGGSAGDNLEFNGTHVYGRGEFRAHGAVLTLFRTELPFTIFKFQHFEPGAHQLVVTESDPETRLVREIDGEPAADVYARTIGTTVDRLDTEVFSRHPFVLQSGGEPFVRSIRTANPDRSLSLYCAIEDGVVLSLGRAVDPVQAATSAFDKVRSRVGKPQLIIGCDCVLRKREFESSGLLGAMGRVMRDNGVIGFSTYGEQFNGIHLNQTFTGVAIGGPP
jgi:hypothetical protein